MDIKTFIVFLIIAFLIYSIIEEIIKAIKEVKLKKLDNNEALKTAQDYIKILEDKLSKK